MILACNNITKHFGEKEILNGISFHVNENEKTAIVGINGAGKSTLFKIWGAAWGIWRTTLSASDSCRVLQPKAKIYELHS